MKLYTEEQVMNTVNAIQSYIEKFGIDGAQPTIKNHLKMLSPIELPSDEEIDKYIEKTFYGVKKHYFKAGVEFMKELILKQNK